MFGWGVSLFSVNRVVGTDVRIWRRLGRGVGGCFVADRVLLLAIVLPGNAMANTLFLMRFLRPVVKLGFFSRETVSRSPA